MITACSETIFESTGGFGMVTMRRAQRARQRHNRVARFYTGHPTWRTWLRRHWRRVWRHLPLSDEEVLIQMRLAQEFGCVDWLRQPVSRLRLLRPLPDPMLAADGKTRFRYFKVQKAACTSVVRMLVATCGRARDLRPGQAKNPYLARYAHLKVSNQIALVNNAGWPGEPFFFRFRPFCAEPQSAIRFCVVRDPVERFVAAFDDIVTRRKFYATWRLEDFLTQIEKTIEEAEKDPREFRVGAFARDMHFRAQHFSLGRDASYFTHIFNLRQLPQLQALLSELAGKRIHLLHVNARADNAKSTISAPQERRIAALYAEDYRLFGRYF